MIYGPETYPNDPRDTPDMPELETKFCPWCGAEVPATEIIKTNQGDSMCNDCFAELEIYAKMNNEIITKIK